MVKHDEHKKLEPRGALSAASIVDKPLGKAAKQRLTCDGHLLLDTMS